MSLYSEIKSHFLLPNAYDDWAQYRNTLTTYLLAETDQFSLPLSFHSTMKDCDFLPSLLVVGAGACNDLDIDRLTPHFSSITLLDYDTDALQSANYTPHKRILRQTESLTGITDNDYNDFCEALHCWLRQTTSDITPENFSFTALSYMREILQKNRQDVYHPAPDSYDYIWCFGVHSQLFIMFAYIYQAFVANLQDEYFHGNTLSKDPFLSYIKATNDSFIPTLNSALLSCAKKGLYLGCEWNEVSPVEGAYQSITDIRDRNLNLTEKIIRWPFDKERDLYYDMLIQQILF